MKTLLITDFTTELANSIKNRLYDTFQIYDLGFPIGTHQLVQSRFEEIAPNCILHIGNGFEKDLTVIDTLPSDLGLFVFVSFFEYKDQRERILDKAVRDVLISRNIPYLIIDCVKPIEFYDHYIITMIHGKLCKINEHFSNITLITLDKLTENILRIMSTFNTSPDRHFIIGGINRISTEAFFNFFKTKTKITEQIEFDIRSNEILETMPIQHVETEIDKESFLENHFSTVLGNQAPDVVMNFMSR